MPKVLLAWRVNVRLHLNTLRAETTFNRVCRFTKPAVAALMLGLWLALLGLSASEKLHHCLHADAAHPEHDCLVTALAKGTALDVPQPEIVVQPAPEVRLLAATEQRPIFSRIDLRLVPGRAPPVHSVLL